MKTLALLGCTCLVILLLAVVILSGGSAGAVIALSEPEMAAVRGSQCDICYLEHHYDCMTVGDLQCTQNLCPTRGWRYWQRVRDTCLNIGEVNNMHCSEPQTEPCRQEFFIVEPENPLEHHKCVARPNDPNFAGWHYYCASSYPDVCELCEWGAPADEPVLTNYYDCIAN